MKEYEQYGRIKEHRRKKDVRKEMENKEPEKEEKKGYYSRFANRNVSLKLINGETLKGTLVTDAYNRYDVILRMEDTEVLLPKHSILCLREVQNENNLCKLYELEAKEQQ